MSHIQNPGGAGSARTLLTGNASFFVATTGNDSNDGLTPGTAWATLQHAMNVIASTLDFAGFLVTVAIGAGSFAGFGVKSTVGDGVLQFLGSGVASTTITAGPNDGLFNFGECWSLNVVCDTIVGVDAVRFLPAANNSAAAAYLTQGNLFLGQFVPFTTNITIDTSNGPNNVLAIGCFFQTGSGTATIAGGAHAVNEFWGIQFGAFVFDSVNWVITGAPDVYGRNFIEVVNSAVYQAAGSFTGSATGSRFLVANAVIFGTGNNLTFFPGSTPGNIANGGVYF